MANLNYSKRLQNLQNRRYDPIDQRVNLSESFSKVMLPENLKYLMESMLPIDRKYNNNTELAATNVMSHLEEGLKLSFSINYRKQGSVMAGTNIKLYSDIDLLSIISGYSFLAPSLLPPSFPYDGIPSSDIEQLRKQATEILKRKYDEVDDSGSKSISIFNKNLKRKVDVVFSFWYNTAEFETTADEYYRGIYLFNFPSKTKQLDFPFANLANINTKGNQTNDGSRRGIRLLKTLKADSDYKIDLSSFQITTIVHSIENHNLLYFAGRELEIATQVSKRLELILSDSNLRKSIKSPNGIERPLQEDSCVPDLRLIKNDLDLLIEDCVKEASSQFTQQQILRY